MQIITRREEKVFAKDADFKFSAVLISAMSETLFFGVGDNNSLKTTTYLLALTDEVRDVCAANAVVEFPLQAIPFVASSRDLRGDK